MKKWLSILVAISLVLTSAIPAFAEETASKGLEQAITQVKNIVTIPSDYKDFQYTSSEYEENGRQVSVWYLNWSKDDYSGGISASVESGGHLINFNTYTDKQNEGLGKITREAGKKAAAAFLAKARPDVAADLRLMENTDYSNSDRHYYNYRLYKNDVMVFFVEVRIEVDKFTGQVIGYNYQGSSEDLGNLPSTDGVIGIDAAKTAYLDKINTKLSYYSNYDYKDKNLTIFPAYAGTNTEAKVIDAKTGEAVPLYSDYINYGSMGGMGSMAKTADSAVAENALSKEELAAVENVNGLISKDKAESILRGAAGITSSMKMLSASLSKSYVEQDKYLWDIGFDGAYGVVNAKTGEVTSFYIYSDTGKESKTGISEAKAKEKAEAFMKQIASEKFDQSRFYESPEYKLYKGVSNDDVTDYSFNYYRQVNGIDFIGNGFTVIVNKANGMITHYDCNWYDAASFPSIDKVITEEEAFDAINATGKMGLMYKRINDGEIALVYDYTRSVGDFLIDPSNGARLGWDGKPFKDTSLPEYTDIKGHWAEAKINKLLENGYYLQGEKFNPSQKINQLSFLRYLYSPIQMYYDDEEFYKMMINDKILKEGEKAPTTIITRQEAAKFVVRFLGQGKVADHPEIFNNPFKDKIADNYKGYAAICFGLKVMQGDSKGRFNGSNQVTNAEAAAIIYNALQVK